MPTSREKAIAEAEKELHEATMMAGDTARYRRSTDGTFTVTSRCRVRGRRPADRHLEVSLHP